MRLHLIAIGLAIPLLLTATVFAVPPRGGSIFGIEDKNDANNTLLDQTGKVSQHHQQHSITTTTDFGSNNNFAQSAFATSGRTHDIELHAKRLDNGLLAYMMVSHIITNEAGTNDVTSNYHESATIPGPTIIITEGDEINLTITNGITGKDGDLDNLVSVHVHGVHYEITSDGTLQHVNGLGDQGAYPEGGAGPDSFTYHWTAGPGTAGSWPYHDHTWGDINGAEHKGLYGMLIVNPASGVVKGTDGKKITNVTLSNVKKDFVLYLGDDAFWGMEIKSDGTQTPLWTNPTLGAKTGDYVRFHLIALGTDAVHTFKISSYKWLDPGTDGLINSKDIGPLENHAFTIKAKKGNAEYMDNNVSNKLMGMKGKFKVTDSGAPTVPSPIPEVF